MLKATQLPQFQTLHYNLSETNLLAYPTVRSSSNTTNNLSVYSSLEQLLPFPHPKLKQIKNIRSETCRLLRIPCVYLTVCTHLSKLLRVCFANCANNSSRSSLLFKVCLYSFRRRSICSCPVGGLAGPPSATPVYLRTTCKWKA
jgi:hypothetical protein